MTAYVCGPREAAELASPNHYSWHKSRGEEPCGKSRGESNLHSLKVRREAAARTAAGIPPPELYVCGEADDRERASSAHQMWHIYYGTPTCRKAKAEHAWKKAEDIVGHPIPDWYPGWRRPRRKRAA